MPPRATAGHRPLHARRHVAMLSALALALAAITLAGCDLMTPPTSPRPSREVSTAQPAPSPTPTELDEVPTLRPDPSGDSVGLLDGANALADLTSYRVAIVSRGIVPATPAGGEVAMTSTLVQGDEPAASFSMTGVDGYAGGRLQAVVIGDRAWLKEGSGAWRPSPGGAADFDAAFTTLSPIDLLTGFDGLSAALRLVGPATRNGQRTIRYRSDANDVLASDAGLSSGSVDAWFASKGGELVAVVIDGTWNLDGAPTRVLLKIDVTRIDDRTNRVVAPI
jgi:hypothetical protein